MGLCDAISILPSATGWRCPGCQRCYSPSTAMCQFCGPKQDGAGKPFMPTVPAWISFCHTCRQSTMMCTSGGSQCLNLVCPSRTSTPSDGPTGASKEPLVATKECPVCCTKFLGFTGIKDTCPATGCEGKA